MSGNFFRWLWRKIQIDRTEGNTIRIRKKNLHVEAFEPRWGPTPGIEMGLTSIGLAIGNPFSQPAHGKGLPVETREAAGPTHAHLSDLLAEHRTPPGVTPVETIHAVSLASVDESFYAAWQPHASTPSATPSFVQPPYQDVAGLADALMLVSRPVSSPLGAPQAGASGGGGNGGGGAAVGGANAGAASGGGLPAQAGGGRWCKHEQYQYG